MEITIDQDEVVALLGPNGAGKTTLLRAIAGLVPFESGYVRLDGKSPGRHRVQAIRAHGTSADWFRISGLPPFPASQRRRQCGLRPPVARHTASRGRRKGNRMVGQGWLEKLFASEAGRAVGRSAPARGTGPGAGSGPASAPPGRTARCSDVTTRAEVRRDLKHHLASFQGIRLLVTHDPLEAVALADRLIVMEGGHLVQTGTSAEVTERPRSQYVADLVGVNLFKGEADDGSVRIPGGPVVAAAGAESGEVFVVIHPRAVAIHRGRPEGSPRNVWPGRASNIELMGNRVRVRIEGEVPLVAEVTPAALKGAEPGGGRGRLAFVQGDRRDGLSGVIVV